MVRRQIISALLSALVGSLAGTLVWVAFEGGTGAINPVRFVTAFAAGTLIFTIPGAILLMMLAFLLADRPFGQVGAAVIVIVAGTLVGAAMLPLISSGPVYFVALGALFGFLTAVAFVGLQWLLGVYPARSR